MPDLSSLSHTHTHTHTVGHSKACAVHSIAHPQSNWLKPLSQPVQCDAPLGGGRLPPPGPRWGAVTGAAASSAAAATGHGTRRPMPTRSR